VKSRIWIKVKSRIRIRIKVKSWIRIPIRIEVKSRIRIRFIGSDADSGYATLLIAVWQLRTTVWAIYCLSRRNLGYNNAQQEKYEIFYSVLRMRIRIKVKSWTRIRIPNNSQATSLNVWNMSLFEHFFKILSLYLQGRIRIRIKVKSWIRIRIGVKVMQIRNTDFVTR
jgi:hypothetical protein